MEFLKRCKNEMNALYMDCSAEIVSNRPTYKRFTALVVFFATLMNLVVMALASGNQPSDIQSLGSKIVNVISEIYDSVFIVITILAALLLVIAFILRMTSNQQRAAQATQWIIRIIICYVCVNCIGVIFKIIQNVTDGMGFDKNQYIN